jgi:hypothetical protein
MRPGHHCKGNAVLITCWSAKGGVGTTVVASALALVLARQHEDVLLVDLAGDVPAALGLSADGPGLAGWLAAGADVPADALARLAVPAASRLSVLPRGDGPLGPPERVEVLASLLAMGPRPVVVDAGTLRTDAGTDDAGWALARGADHSLLVLRPCFLAVQRAVAAPLRPSSVVLVREPGRSLTALDVEQTLHVPVRAEVAVEPAVARAVDAGLLASRLPRVLVRALREAA